MPKKLGFIIRLIFSGKGVICICIQNVKLNEVDHFDEIFKVLSKLTIKKLNIKNK